MLERWSARLESAVESLAADPRVRIVRFVIGPRASDRELRAFERDRGYALDPALRALYGQANGVQLRWILADDAQQVASAARLPSEATTWDYAIQDDLAEQGRILLHPLEELS